MLFSRKPKIIFLYATQFQHAGSTVMRGQQLSELFARHYSEKFSIKYRPFSTKYRNAILILTKGVCNSISLEEMHTLKTRHNKLLLDLIDMDLEADKVRLADAVIAASYEAYAKYREAGAPAFLVNHHVDPRLSTVAKSHPKATIGYFGEVVNTVRTDKIANEVDFYQIDTYRQTNDWFDIPAQYNVHYAVRADSIEGYKPSLKPFLKGFIAAACGANIIIQKDQKEALHWLGADYPYLLPANPSEQQILKMIQYVQDSFGTDVWKQGLKTMQRIKAQTSEGVIAEELYKMLQTVGTV